MLQCATVTDVIFSPDFSPSKHSPRPFTVALTCWISPLSKCQQDEYCEFEKFMWHRFLVPSASWRNLLATASWSKEKQCFLVDKRAQSQLGSDLKILNLHPIAGQHRERETATGSGLSISCADISLRCRIRTIAFFFLACCFQRFSARFIKNVVTFPKTKKKRRDFS